MRMMPSGSMAAWRAASEVPDRDDVAPDWRVIRHSQHVACKAIQCACGAWMPPGTEYEQVIALEDRKFVILRHCRPTDCAAVRESQPDPEDWQW